jgi:sporulation protein YlmC with PRC-barrel domain
MSAPTAVSPETLIGRKILDLAGKKIGVVAQVYLDDQTGQPDWITVNTGLFGMKENFVPLVGAKLVGHRVVLPVSKVVVKASPVVDDPRHLDIEQERALYDYYGTHVGDAAPGGDRGNQAD